MLGDFGHLSIIVALVAIALAIYAYYVASNANDLAIRQEWLRFARGCFIAHGLAVFSTVCTLYSIIYFHHYEYQYAWKHSSNDLPVYFIISCFWEGQEGSFLVWIFWNALIGMLIMRTNKSLEAPTMVFFGIIQLCLVSMIIGIQFSSAFKFGSSPFSLLRDVQNSEIFQINPSFVPADGNGLNPLLQNIWMVIHPPIIFLGFALSGVPFCLAMAALWQHKTKDFITQTAPWVLVCVGIMGVGIVMGAYWAYETLNFGGYWNWDPVENAILIPWLVLLSAVHGMTLYRRKAKGISLTIALVLIGFILIVYSTFLTRSGILGNASVHAFTDLGLSGQLLIFLLLFVFGSIAMVYWKRNTLKEQDENTAILSLDFWMLLGISTVCLSAFQVLLPTSIPVLNVILENVGIDKSFAAPADQIAFYSKFQIWFAFAFCIFAGVAQVFYWKKIKNIKHLENAIVWPILATLLGAAAIVFFSKMRQIEYICLTAAALYLLFVCVSILINLIKNSAKTSLGGLLAHVGMAVMLIGFVFSEGHKKVISQNLTLNAPESNLPVHTVQENLLLSRNVSKENNGYLLTYTGSFFESADREMHIDKDRTLDTYDDQYKIITDAQAVLPFGKIETGDTIKINVENTYYTLEIKNEQGEIFTMMPRMQNNPTMGFIASPDIKSFFTKDIYTHITNFPDKEKVKWGEPQIVNFKLGESHIVNGLNVTLEQIDINDSPLGIPQMNNDVPIQATVRIEDTHGSYTAQPIFHIDAQRNLRLFPDEIQAIGTKVHLSKISPQTNEYELTIVSSQRDWVTIKSIEMPFISLVWIGSLLITCGIGIALYFRTCEAMASKAEKPFIERHKITETAPQKWSLAMEQNAENVTMKNFNQA
jgi:cytochrome c-type biogenesis protein CcmF